MYAFEKVHIWFYAIPLPHSPSPTGRSNNR